MSDATEDAAPGGDVRDPLGWMRLRIGQGFDAHRFGPGSSVRLGGVEIAHDHGLVAHSDGDVVLHAICDALLGAAALGDLGAHFPDTDPGWQGVSSRRLLRRVVAAVGDAGYAPVNVDVTVVAERPRIRPHVRAMQENIAADLGLGVDAVSVKGTTTEGMGFAGRREGIACLAVALLVRGR